MSRGAAVTGLTHRQNEILNIARAFGRVMVEDLARRFEVSAQTIRKDLNDLCDHRSLTRIHGGAIIASGVENLAYEARRFVAAEEKKAIGAAAAALIPNGCSLFINIGTTTEEVASALTSHEDLLVITNNLNVAMLLVPASAHRGDRGRRRGAPRRRRGDRLDRDQPDRPVQGRLRHHRRFRDRRGGRAAGFRLSRGAGGAGHHRQCAQRHAGRRLAPNSGAARRSASPISARSRLLSPTPRCRRAWPTSATPAASR